MSPRPYRMARRRESTDENRQRIINAARELLASSDGAARFSLEAVARRAGVARMTVYYQFGSLRGLLQGLCDSLAVAGGMNHLADAFQLMSHPLVPLDDLVEYVGDFPADAGPIQWKAHRKVTFLQGDERGEQQFRIEGFIETMLKARNG